jgi:threonine dehydrogenase-like Zn-dependent dehydrogenase
MRAVVYHGARDFRYETVADPVLEAPSDALVRVTRSAICGSDLHLWNGLPVPDRGFPVGHEFVGVVEEAGAAKRCDPEIACSCPAPSAVGRASVADGASTAAAR